MTEQWTPERIARERAAWSTLAEDSSILDMLAEIERLQARVVELEGQLEAAAETCAVTTRDARRFRAENQRHKQLLREAEAWITDEDADDVTADELIGRIRAELEAPSND